MYFVQNKPVVWLCTEYLAASKSSYFASCFSFRSSLEGIVSSDNADFKFLVALRSAILIFCKKAAKRILQKVKMCVDKEYVLVHVESTKAFSNDQHS